MICPTCAFFTDFFLLRHAFYAKTSGDDHPLTYAVKENALTDSLDGQHPGTQQKIPGQHKDISEYEYTAGVSKHEQLFFLPWIQGTICLDG